MSHFRSYSSFFPILLIVGKREASDIEPEQIRTRLGSVGSNYDTKQPVPLSALRTENFLKV